MTQIMQAGIVYSEVADILIKGDRPVWCFLSTWR